MSDAVAKPATAAATALRSGQDVSLLQIFLEFLFIGATSFGGGVVAYLRDGLVEKRRWVSDQEFVDISAISQSLPA